MFSLARWLASAVNNFHSVCEDLSAAKPNRTARRRPLSFEPLESRTLLTVTVLVNDLIDQLDNPTNATPASLSSTVSLRDAINAANNSSVPTQITFDHNVFQGFQTITLTEGQLNLNNSSAAITITGPGTAIASTGANPSPTLQISGNNATTIFNISRGTTAIFSDLTVADGTGSNAAASTTMARSH